MHKAKAIISTILILCFILCAVTGAAMFFFQGGMIWFLPRKYVTNIHSGASLAMILAVFLHFALNYKIFRAEIACLLGGERSKKRENKGN